MAKGIIHDRYISDENVQRLLKLEITALLGWGLCGDSFGMRVFVPTTKKDRIVFFSHRTCLGCVLGQWTVFS